MFKHNVCMFEADWADLIAQCTVFIYCSHKGSFLKCLFFFSQSFVQVERVFLERLLFVEDRFYSRHDATLIDSACFCFSFFIFWPFRGAWHLPLSGDLLQILLVGGLGGVVAHVRIAAVLDAQDLFLGQVEAIQDGAVERINHLRLHALYEEGGIEGSGPRVAGHGDQRQDQDELSNAAPFALFTTHSTCHFCVLLLVCCQTKCFHTEIVVVFFFT